LAGRLEELTPRDKIGPAEITGTGGTQRATAVPRALLSLLRTLLCRLHGCREQVHLIVDLLLYRGGLLRRPISVSAGQIPFRACERLFCRRKLSGNGIQVDADAGNLPCLGQTPIGIRKCPGLERRDERGSAGTSLVTGR